MYKFSYENWQKCQNKIEATRWPNENENSLQNTKTGKFQTNRNNTIDHTKENLISVNVEWPMPNIGQLDNTHT